MKKWIKILCMNMIALIALSGCGMMSKDFKADEFKSEKETYQKASQDLIQHFIAVQYGSDGENKVKEKEAYKQLSESLSYFEHLKLESAPSEIQPDLKIVKEKVKAVETYYEQLVSRYAEAKGDQVTVVRLLSEVIEKSENKTLMKEFATALSNVNQKIK